MEIDRGKPKYELLEEKRVSVPLFYHKFHTDWPGIEPGASAMERWLLTAWAMARPLIMMMMMIKSDRLSMSPHF
jgi:hypothetical protein